MISSESFVSNPKQDHVNLRIQDLSLRLDPSFGMFRISSGQHALLLCQRADVALRNICEAHMLICIVE